MTVTSVQVGAATENSAIVATEVSSTANVRVFVATNPALTGATIYGPVVPSTNGTQFVAKVTLTELLPDTTYYFQVEHAAVLNVSFPGQFETNPIPNTPASFTIGVGGDSGLSPATPGIGAVLASTRLSNHTIFNTIRNRAVDERWKMMVHLGDLHYYDLSSGSHGIIGGASLANYRRAWSDVLLQPNQHILYRSCPTVKMEDDHDLLGNNSYGAQDPVGSANWAQVYREREPHYPLETTGGVYFSHQIGRVLFIITDSRFYSSPDSDADTENKTMWGDAQKTWLLLTLATTQAKAVVFITSRQWTRTSGDDTWASFSEERDEIAALLAGLSWTSRMVMIWADRHAVKIQDTQPWGSFPAMQAAPFDAAGGSPITDYPDGLPDIPGTSQGQYGTVTVDDNGDRIIITMEAWFTTTSLGSTSITVETPVPPVVPSRAAFASLTSGSHQAAFEARVCTFYQDGEDPVGTDIPILSGDVTLDATANVTGTLEITTNGDGTWPQNATDLLSPFGNEIFVRRGIYLDGEILWVPLGYYRIQDPEQGQAPDGPIAITGLDRMAGIIDGRLLAPREFTATRSIRSVFEELVYEIYPEATILFDDPVIENSLLGRTVGSEDSRFDILKEIADSHGKIMFWDTIGFLRIETAPDPSVPLWLFAGGRQHGVLVSASRNVSRVGVYNAVVASGEGAGNEAAPVRAVAYDNNENSPTYFFGKFGQVPRFYSSPLITTTPQAVSAARQLMRRNLGFPYNVAFQISPNPAVRPWDPIRIIYKDGQRELHIVEQITIPLDAETVMNGATREQTLVVLGDQS